MISKENGFLKRFFIVGVLFALGTPGLCAAENNSAHNVQADVVWASSDGLREELYFATQREGKWSEPVKITDDNADNLHPCLDRGSDGKNWLVWTAIEQGGYEVRYAVEADGKWSDPQTLPTGLPSNIAPTVIVDVSDIPWVVWSGNNGITNDEIYYTRYIDGKWQKPQLVNVVNDVPDVLPVISVNQKGKYLVNWDGYRDGMYRKLQAVWNGNGWGPEKRVEPVSENMTIQQIATEKQEDLPAFIEDTRQAFMRSYSR